MSAGRRLTTRRRNPDFFVVRTNLPLSDLPNFASLLVSLLTLKRGLRGKTTVDLPVYCFTECRAREIVKCELNKFILCDMSTFEHEYSQVCL